MKDIYDFLSSLYGGLENKYVYLFELPGIKTHCFPTSKLGKMAHHAAQLAQKKNLYFGIGAVDHMLRLDERPKAEEVTAIPGLWIDIDIAGAAHRETMLPPKIEDALGLLPDIQPSMIVSSGYGIHVYWLFREPWEFDTEEERQKAGRLSQNLQVCIKKKAREKGWKVDTTSDLARILRLPGSMNRKIPENPVPCRVLEKSQIRYNPSDLEFMILDLEPCTAPLRLEGFTRNPSDGPAELQIKNCKFIQHCLVNADTISYDEWLAMLTNISRASDGLKAAHDISAKDKNRYDFKNTEAKITKALQMNPQTCEYIRSIICFQGCPEHGCGMQAPCGWSLSKIGRAKAIVKEIAIPEAENVLVPHVLDALNILKQEDPTEYTQFKGKCKGKINLNELEKSIKSNTKAKLHIVQPGEKPGKRMLSDTVPDVPVDLVLPPNFTFEETGILHAKENSQGVFVTSIASGCPVLISSRLCNIDTGLEKIELCFRYMGKWKKIPIERSIVMNSRTITGLADYGLPVSSEKAKYLVKWLDALADANKELIPVQYTVSKLGWRKKNEFILPGFDDRYKIDLDDEGSRKTIQGFGIAGKQSAWLDAMQELRKTPLARFILAASFAGPILKIAGQRNFIVHNWGQSQDGKTATLWAAISVWGNPDLLIGTFDATPTAIERKATLFSDLPLGINEREVLGKWKKDDISSLLYMLGEGRGRGRGDKRGLQSLSTWRTVVLSTGESTLSGASSQDGMMTRVLEICGGPLAHDREFARSLYHLLPRCYGHGGHLFLQKLLQEDPGNIVDAYRGTQGIMRDRFPNRLDSHIDAVACVSVADYFASMWVFGESIDEAGKGTADMSRTILEDLITLSEASEAERAWEEFVDYLAENEEKFSDRTMGQRFGIKKDNYTYVIRRVVDEFLTNRGSSPKKIVKDWGDSGKIGSFTSSGKKRFDKQMRLFNSNPRVIQIIH